MAGKVGPQAMQPLVAQPVGESKAPELMEPSEEEKQYFESYDGLVRVFDFDKPGAVEYTLKVAERNLCCCPPMSLAGVCCYYMCMQHNIRADIECQHVALTQDGIKYVKDRRRTGCGFDCQEQGKVTKTVPFDKLTDCDLEEPAGAEGPLCCLVNRVLTTVNVDTASSGGAPAEGGPGGGHELSLVGLKDPHGFKNMVWAMKRGGAGVPSMQAAPAARGDMTRDTAEHLSGLLVKNNELLEEQVALLRKIEANTGKA